MEIDLQQQLLLVSLAFCILPLLLTIIVSVAAFYFGRKAFDRFISPDTKQLEQRFAMLRTANPEFSKEQLVNKVIHQQALRSGLVGAVTGIGGFVTLPVALPIDVVLSLRIQAALVEFIAQSYGLADNPVEARVRMWLVMSGSARVSEATLALILRFLVRIMGKSLSKFIPILGAVVSFAVNYALVQAMGRAAVRWYSSRSSRHVAQDAAG